MPMYNYDKAVSKFIKEAKNTTAKNDLIENYNYIKHGFATELAMANRDYDLGLTDITNVRNIQIKAYVAENRIRSYLGMDPLPEINDSIL